MIGNINAGTTATEAHPASIDSTPPLLPGDVTTQVLPNAEPIVVDGSETDPAKVVEASETNPTLHDAGTTTTMASETQPASIDTTATGIPQLKAAGQKRIYIKRAKVPVAQTAFKDELFDGDAQAVHAWRPQSRRELWQRGHQTASRPSRIAHEVSLVMCDTVKECHTSMRMHGWAILRDITN
jgi:hypothetical protein